MIEHLSQAGFDVAAQRTESEAEFETAVQGCDIVLADYTLPQFGALDALRMMRSRKIDRPVIVVSGSVGEEKIIECLQEGAVDYVLKDRFIRLGHAVARALETQALRERDEAALKKLIDSERRHRVLFERHPKPMWVFDLETRQILAVNDAAIAHYGYSREEFLEMSIFDLRSTKEVAKLQARLAMLPTSLGTSGTWKHRKKDGTEILIEIASNDLPFEGRAARLVMIEDVTEQRKLEQEQRLHAAMLEIAANPIVVTDAAGVITWVNAAFTSLTGYAGEEAIGQTLRIVKSGQHDEAFFRELWSTIIAGQVWRGEIVNRRKDGTLFHAVDTITPMHGEDGAIVHFIAVMHDVTERRQAEIELRETHAQLRRLLEHSPAIIYSLRLGEGAPKPIFVSENLHALTGWAVEEVLHEGWWLANVHPEDRDVALASSARAGQIGASRAEYRMRCKDGTYRWIEDSNRVLRDDLGRPFEMVGSWTDIDARRRAEEARHATEERFEKLFHASPIAIAYSTVDGRKLIEANERYLEFFGYQRAELVGRPSAEVNLWADAAQRERVLNQFGDEGRLQNIEVRFVRKSGEQRVGLVTGETLLLEDETVRVWMIADITERKKLEAELFRAQRVESIGRLANGIAHDMNNILAPIMLSAPLLRMNLSPADFEKTLSTVETSAKRGADLVRQLLLFSRGVESGRGPVRPDLLIKELAKIVKETFPKNIAIEIDCPGSTWAVSGDATQLHQVLLNLCVNARDAMPEGGTLRIKAENVDAGPEVKRWGDHAQPGPYVVLRVSDTGAGIPPEIVDRIFDPFFTTKEANKGTGLGLSTVHGIVTSHGGFIRLQSELGRGTTFEIHLPATRESGSGQSNLPRAKPANRGQGEKILVVDDEESIRSVLRQTLAQHGYRVLTAADGEAAAAIFAREGSEIKLIITDIDMPLMNGLGLIRRVKQTHPQARFILSSGLSTDAPLQARTAEAKALGVHTVLRKPYQADEMLAAVQRELGVAEQGAAGT